MPSLADLPRDELLVVFKSLDAKDLAQCAVTCRRWKQLATCNEVWAAKLTAPHCPKIDVAAVSKRGLTACRDYWCLKHWLRQTLFSEHWRERSESAAALEANERMEARRCLRAEQRALAGQWRNSAMKALTTGPSRR